MIIAALEPKKKSSSVLDGYTAKAKADEDVGAGPLAGSALIKAIKAGDGAAVFEAFKAMDGAIEADEPVDEGIGEE